MRMLRGTPLASSFLVHVLAQVLTLAAPAQGDLLARWSFDSGAGGTTAEEPVSGFDGTLTGNAEITAAGGITGGALSLEGPSPGFVNAGDVLALTGNPRFSIQAWVRTTATAGLIVVGRHQQFVTTGYWLGLNDTGDGSPAEPVGSFKLFQSDNSPFNSGDQGIADGDWHQIVAVRDTNANQLRLYVDGARAPDAGATGGLHEILATAGPFMMGGFLSGVALVNAYTGSLDEIRVWDDALTDQDVAFLYEHPDSLNAVLCGDAGGNGSILANDALGALRTAVGTADCPLCVCDVNESGDTTAGDALQILRSSVGQNVTLHCPICVTGDQP